MAFWSTAQERNDVWQRLNVGMDYGLAFTNLSYGPGLLRNHPNRVATIRTTYRVGRRWELGLYLAAQGSDMSSMSAERSIEPSSETMYTLTYSNGYQLTPGLMARFHLLPFDKRETINMDIALRAGIGFGAEGNGGAWAGYEINRRINRNLLLTLAFDLGSVIYNDYEMEALGIRATVRTKMSVGISVAL